MPPPLPPRRTPSLGRSSIIPESCHHPPAPTHPPHTAHAPTHPRTCAHRRLHTYTPAVSDGIVCAATLVQRAVRREQPAALCVSLSQWSDDVRCDVRSCTGQRVTIHNTLSSIRRPLADTSADRRPKRAERAAKSRTERAGFGSNAGKHRRLRRRRSASACGQWHLSRCGTCGDDDVHAADRRDVLGRVDVATAVRSYSNCAMQCNAVS